MPFENIRYKSFVWKIGNTSFRTKDFNYMTERQLDLLDEFWGLPENAGLSWGDVQIQYYHYLIENGFMTGDEKNKDKTAREKTSGLVSLGLLDEERRLTVAGRCLLDMSRNKTYDTKTQLGISEDSLLYLNQLLKHSEDINGDVVRPLIVVIYLLSELEYLSFDELKYLVPLCVNEETTSYILSGIRRMRSGDGDVSIDSIIESVLLSKANYREGLDRFLRNEYSDDLLLSVSMNRKSPAYDKAYTLLYRKLHSVFMDRNFADIYPLFLVIKGLTGTVGGRWRQLLFQTPSEARGRRNPEEALIPLPWEVVGSEAAFREFFYVTMHLNKAKSTLEDYFDLNRRYLGLSNCFIYEDGQMKLDVVPKQFFFPAVPELYGQAYESCGLLEQKTSLEQICPALSFREENIIEGINREYGVEISTIEEAFVEVEKIRYERFGRLVDSMFSDENLVRLLECFDRRDDKEIKRMVTDNADVPTIFEYVLGVIWYKVSCRQGKALDYLKLSLDANLLPVTHAAGGEADIVWEYPETELWPEHSLLLEATLADRTNQRRMEMEPVSRHLGNHLLRTGNLNSYCIFATSDLNVNVISDFRMRKNGLYCDPADPDRYVQGMKIMPLSTDDLRDIIRKRLTYMELYPHYDKAFNASECHPSKWYEGFVKIGQTFGV